MYRVTRSGTIDQFTKRVNLDNSYCNCLHLMCRVEKIPGIFFEIERSSHDTLCCSALPLEHYRFEVLTKKLNP